MNAVDEAWLACPAESSSPPIPIGIVVLTEGLVEGVGGGIVVGVGVGVDELLGLVDAVREMVDVREGVEV